MSDLSRQIKSDRAFLPTLIAVSMIGPLALNMFLPSLVHMEEALNTTYAMVQLTITLFLATMAVATLAVGPLSDRFGRRPVVLYGTGIFVAGTVFCLIAPTIETLIGARIIQSVGACVGIIIARAIVRDVYSRDESASMIGYVTMGMAVAPMIAPAIGGYLDSWYGWRATFAFLLVFGALVFAMSYRNLPETNRHPTRSIPLKELMESWRQVLLSRPFLVYAGAVTFASCQYFAFIGGGPYICNVFLEMSATEYGLYFAMIAGGYICGNFTSGRFAARAGVFRMMIAGSTIAGVAIVAMTVVFLLDVFHPLSLFGPMFFVALGNGMLIPSASAGAVSVRPDLSGAASGITGTLQVGTGALIGAVIGSLLNSTNQVEVFTIPLCLCAAISLALTLMSRRY